MWIIPITYKLKYDIEQFNQNEIMDLIESYLYELDFNYINRNDKYISYHMGFVTSYWSFRNNLGSGSIRIDSKNKQTIITLKHSFVFLFLFFFTVIYLLMTSRFSTFDDFDKQICTVGFVWLFGMNYLLKLSAHYKLKRKLNELIKENAKLKDK